MCLKYFSTNTKKDNDKDDKDKGDKVDKQNKEDKEENSKDHRQIQKRAEDQQLLKEGQNLKEKKKVKINQRRLAQLKKYRNKQRKMFKRQRLFLNFVIMFSVIIVNLFQGWLFFSMTYLLLRKIFKTFDNKILTVEQAMNKLPQLVGSISITSFEDTLGAMIQRVESKKIIPPINTVAKFKAGDVNYICFLSNITDFLYRIESLPVLPKVQFHYFSNNQKEISQDPPKRKGLFLVAFIFSLLYFRKKLLKFVKEDIMEQLRLKDFSPINPAKIQTYFKDVAGLNEAKCEMIQFVDFLKNSEKYVKMGARIPRGALLTGPPGTGKTLLARACAGEAGVPFFYVSGSEFIEKYVGLGANRIRRLFAEASKQQPSIIFIDQIDAIGKKRKSIDDQSATTLNELLVCMDGYQTTGKVIVMAATNMKQMLDPALLRPGRFDRSIDIDLPNFDQRMDILKVHLSKIKFSEVYTIDDLARKLSILTPGFSGAELANICNEAAILAAREGKNCVDLVHFQKATERVRAGLEKRSFFTAEEKELLAYYESGKVVVSWFTESVDPIIKISILPYSKSSKGYSQTIQRETPVLTREQLLNQTICCLAGRTAELHFKQVLTTNGEKDLSRAQRIITLMVTKYGMSKSFEMIAFPDTEYMKKPYSETMAEQIDTQVQELRQLCQTHVEKIVQEKAGLIELVKMKLLEKETLSHNQLKEILGERQFANNENYRKYLDEQASERTKGSDGPQAGAALI